MEWWQILIIVLARAISEYSGQTREEEKNRKHSRNRSKRPSKLFPC